MREYRAFIDNEWQAHDGPWIDVLDPATEEVVARSALCAGEEVDLAVRAARSALAGPWARLAPAERARLLRRLADALRRDVESIAELETSEVGKAISKARGDVVTAAATLEFYAGAVEMPAPVRTTTRMGSS